MKLFSFDSYQINMNRTEENGWLFKSKINKLGYFILKSPVQKEVTHSKGTSVRYVKHTVLGVGYVNSDSQFIGIAMFDLFIRSFIAAFILLGVGYSSNSLLTGTLCAFLFYILWSFLSSSDDDRLLRRAKLFLESSKL